MWPTCRTVYPARLGPNRSLFLKYLLNPYVVTGAASRMMRHHWNDPHLCVQIAGRGTINFSRLRTGDHAAGTGKYSEGH